MRADLVQRKGRTLSKLLRRMACSVTNPNQHSTRSSHEAPVGVKWNWGRRRAASHRFNRRMFVGAVVVASQVQPPAPDDTG